MNTNRVKVDPRSIWNTAVLPSDTAFLPLYGIEAGHFFARWDYRVDRQYHNSFLLLYTTRGCGRLAYRGAEHALPEHTAIVIDCTHPHFYAPQGDKWDFLWLHFTGESAPAIYDFLYPEGPYGVKVTDQEFLTLFEQVLDELPLYDPVHRYSQSCGIQTLLALMARARTTAGRAADTTGEGIIDEAVRYIDARYMEPVRVSALSADLNISEYHFIRLFRRRTGITPYAYLLSRRILAAKKHLVETTSSVEEIAAACGFSDVSNFIAHFRKLTGETPLQYRRSFR